ncbi:DUF1801 domain-containing protein [Actinomadura macrotermitis]|uniref:YdhG-like domain-containing protein n=1 Tax=Actinomadura macrotermitis TaxID=2585200 RepID=A0A7K0BUM7_9ACTN|nr:DUF1801 domain-containing protein [Actinomadura macrotermitis]MQY04898.1 hypothetical protein [Actinomadura macrotermitis]
MAKPSTVQEYIEAVPAPLREVAEKARQIIDAALPDAGALWHGHPTWSLGGAPGREPVALLKAYKDYVTFGLWQGQEVDDPSGRLEAGARRMASVRLRGLDDIDPGLFADWLRQASQG